MRAKSVRSLALALAAAATACARASTTPRPQLLTDTTIVDLRGPTLVAYFIATQSQVDREPALMNALDDFQYSLDAVRGELQRHGVQVLETYSDSMTLRWADGRQKKYATADSDTNRVGYHMFRPDATPVTYPQVLTNSDLLDAAKQFFGW